MKIKKIVSSVVLLLCLLASYSCDQEALGIYFPEVSYTINKTSYDKLELEIIDLVNEYRNSIALSSLKKV